MPLKSRVSTIQHNNIVYCVHQVNDKVVDALNSLPLDVHITFDDCLYSQYHYYKDIKNQNRTYFLCPSLLNETGKFDINLSASQAMEKHFYYDCNTGYMSLEHVKELSELYDIGGHSYYHKHTKYNSLMYSTLVKKHPSLIKYAHHSYLVMNNREYIIEDTELLIDWFIKNLHFIPWKYAFPFDETNRLLMILLNEYGFNNFYGDERIDIEKIINKQIFRV